jgi:hypothetical protein
MCNRIEGRTLVLRMELKNADEAAERSERRVRSYL